jgi:transposase
MDAPTLNGIDVPKWKCELPLKRMGASAMKITTVGIDLAKNVFQVLSVHRVRQGFVKARTAQANQIRGLLGEFGLVIPQGIYNVAKARSRTARECEQ